MGKIIQKNGSSQRVYFILFFVNINLAFITETWPKDSVSDSVVQVRGFAVVREDRQVIDHGVVCAYIQEGNCK